MALLLACVAAAGATSNETVSEVGLRPGDFVARRGVGLFSDRFADISVHDKRFSHIAVIVGTAGAWDVVHTLANDLTGEGGVTREPLRTFLARASDHAFFRLNLTPTQCDAFVRRVLELLAAHVAFDTAFDLHDSDRLYCTELIWRAVLDTSGIDIAPEKTPFMGQSVLSLENITTGSPYVRPIAVTGSDL